MSNETKLLELNPLRDWQARQRAKRPVPPFEVPEYEDFAPMVQWMERARDTIEAQAAEIKRLRGVLDALLQHDASSFFGADREKNQRASYRGVIRKAKKARAALGETK